MDSGRSEQVTQAADNEPATQHDWLILVAALRRGVEIYRVDDRLRMNGPQEQRESIRYVVADRKPQLLDILTPGSPLAWLWDMYRHVVRCEQSGVRLGHVQGVDGRWWELHANTTNLVAAFCDWGRGGGKTADALAIFHDAVEIDCLGWRGVDYVDLFPVVGAPRVKRTETAAAVRVGPPGSLMLFRGPSFPEQYVRTSAIPAEALEYRQELTGGKGEWKEVPEWWRKSK